MGNTVRPSPAADAAPSDRTPFRHESSGLRPRPAQSNRIWLLGASLSPPFSPPLLPVQHVDRIGHKLHTLTHAHTHTHTAGPHPLKTRALLPVLAWPRFEWFVQFQSKAWLVPCKTNDRFQRCGAKCANQPIRSNRVRLGQVGSGTCFLSRSPWAYNHQLNVSTSIWTPWLDLGPKRQVDIPIYPKHITSYLLLWATYISHIAFNPFRAIFAYRQRQAIFILTYTHA